jgi:hypothetical protein
MSNSSRVEGSVTRSAGELISPVKFFSEEHG